MSLVGQGFRVSPSGTSGFYQATVNSNLAMMGENSTQARWHLLVGYTGGGLYIGKMAVVHQVLTPKPHNLVSPCFSSASWAAVLLPEPRVSAWSKLVCAPALKGMFEFPTTLHLTRTVEIPTDFHNQILQGFLFLALGPQAGALEWVWDSSLLNGWDIPPDVQLPHVGVGPTRFASLPLPLALIVVSSLCP